MPVQQVYSPLEGDFGQYVELESGGLVEIKFTSEGPGTILVEVNGVLTSH
jgi:hypothetical protein